MSNSFSDKLTMARLMTAGIRAHETELSKTSITSKYADDIEKVLTELQDLDIEQERLKSALKTCTKSLSDKSKVLNELFAEAKRNVKFAIPQSGWKEFGISDKR